VFVWTPPHFWALAIARKDEYAKVGIPMLPVTHGVAFTRLQVLLYTLLLTAVTLMPFVTGMSGLIYLVAALVLNAMFIGYAWTRERNGRAPLVSVKLFSNLTSNLGLLTQNLQWLVLQGAFFVISVFLQQVRNFSAIETGLVLLPATIGLLLSSAAAPRMARRHSQRRLIRFGFFVTALGLGLLLALGGTNPSVWSYLPGLFLMGVGVGIMLTASVNLVQSAWPENVQGDISGVSRSVSNLGSSLGVAIAGSLVAGAIPGGGQYFSALVIVGAFAAVGWLAALLIPNEPQKKAQRT